METNRDRAFGDPDRTVPEEIADLDDEVRVMFERVRVRLGMAAGGPEMIGRYELQDWIGRGGMGEVYRAYDVELDREVALKVIAPQPGSDVEVLRQRLQREAQLLARLDDANVVKVYDAGIHLGRAYFVMELVRGATLRQLQSAGALTTVQLLDRYIEAARGLAAAHAHGVIHRDFKPDNVFVGEDGRARVGDFGLGYLLGGADELDEPGVTEVAQLVGVTEAGELLGTRGYMAPEQLRGDPSDARADQFALCVSIWEGLTGSRPFVGASVHALLDAIDVGPRGGEAIDGRLARALRIGLSPQADRRHPGVTDIVGALEQLRDRPARRRRRVWRSSVGVVLVLALLGAWWGYRVANPRCQLAEQIGALVDSHEWDAFSDLAPRETQRRFAARLDAMTQEARRACRTGDGNLAKRQHVESRFHALHELIKRPFDERWHERVALFEQDFIARASVPMTPEGYDVLERELQPLEDSWELPRLLGKCDELLADAWDGIDRAVFLLRCARAKSNQGRYADAIVDFKGARRLATIEGDPQRSLDATLGAARTYLTREQAYERGDELLDQSGDLFVAAHTSALDRRWAEYDELRAILLARRHGQVAEAVALQRWVVARELMFGDSETRVRALVNLANFVELLPAPRRAASIYRMARNLDPDEPELLLNYGRLLFNEFDELDESRSLMEQVLADADHDLHLTAMTVMLGISITADARTRMDAERRRLATLLRDEQAGTPSQADDAWKVMALAAWILGDLQAFDDAVQRLSDAGRDFIDQVIAD